MEYETADGSHFCLREVWTSSAEGTPQFVYTSVTAIINGIPYACQVETDVDHVDQVEIAERLASVPLPNIYPVPFEGMTHAPTFDLQRHYLKAPSFSYEDTLPGRTFVAECMLREIKALERLRRNPHRNIVAYLGCVVHDGRLTHICLQRLALSLVQFVRQRPLDRRVFRRLMDGLVAGVDHLHALGLAHNDLNPENVCIADLSEPEAVLIDFDSCLPFGQPLMKGVGIDHGEDGPVSSPDNDFDGIAFIEDFLLDHIA